jgi:hypothetical protein
MSVSHQSSATVRIEPYCIFCGGATDNVERYTISDSSIQDSTYHYSSLTVPFPAHPECFRQEKRKKPILILKVLLPFVVFLSPGAVFLLSPGIAAHPMAFVVLVGGLLLGFVLTLVWAFAALRIVRRNDPVPALENTILQYYRTHRQ